MCILLDYVYIKKISMREWVTFRWKDVQICETNSHRHSGQKVLSVWKDHGADLKNAKYRHPAPHGTTAFSKYKIQNLTTFNFHWKTHNQTNHIAIYFSCLWFLRKILQFHFNFHYKKKCKVCIRCRKPVPPLCRQNAYIYTQYLLQPDTTIIIGFCQLLHLEETQFHLHTTSHIYLFQNKHCGIYITNLVHKNIILVKLYEDILTLCDILRQTI